jgi:hypothetical protein
MSEATKIVHSKLNNNGIIMPYPHMSLTVDHNDKNLLGSALYLMKEGHKVSQG